VSNLIIRSRRHPLIQHWVAWQESAHQRKKLGGAVLEGVHLIRDCPWTLDTVLICERAINHPEIVQLLVSKQIPSFSIVESSVFKQCTVLDPEVGIVAMVRIPAEESLNFNKGTYLWLERIQDPGNVGTIIRSAAAASLTGVLLGPECVSVWSPKVLRAAMGGHFFIPIWEQVTLDVVCAQFNCRWATSLGREAVPYDQVRWQEHQVLLLGNEGGGLSVEALSRSSGQVVIPMDPKIESLNVGVACGILCFEWKRSKVSCSNVTLE
jgi:TrmH family RNA methyltransferase